MQKWKNKTKLRKNQRNVQSPVAPVHRSVSQNRKKQSSNAVVEAIVKMIISILGTGCPKCKELEANARKAVEELKIKAEIEKVTDVGEIVDYGVMSTPAIVIDGEVKASGRIPTVEEIKEWLK